MEKLCVVCHLREFRFRCIQCHKPVCDECAFKTEHGAFCGRNCATAYRDFKKSQVVKAPRKSGRLLVALIAFAAAVAIAAAIAYKMGLLPGFSSGQ